MTKLHNLGGEEEEKITPKRKRRSEWKRPEIRTVQKIQERKQGIITLKISRTR